MNIITISSKLFKFIIKSDYFKIILFFCLVLAVFFYKPIFYNLSILPAINIYYMDNIYRELFFQIKDLPQNNLLTDIIFQMYPWQHFLNSNLDNSFMLLWNPYNLTGLPFLANSQSSIFEITKIFSYILKISTQSFMLFSNYITLFLAGIFTYLYAKNSKVGEMGSLTSGLSFMFSGPIIAWMGYPLTNTAIWLPFLLLCIDKIIEGSKTFWISIFALAIAFQFFAGNPEISWFLLLTSFIYSIYKIRRFKPYSENKKIILQKSGSLFLSLFLGLAIATIQLLPTLEFLLQSEALSVGRSGLADSNILEIVGFEWNGWHNITDIKQSLETVIPLAYPDFFGNPVSQKYWGLNNYNEAAIYIGIIPLVFVLMALFSLFKKNQKYKNKQNISFWFWIGFGCFTVFASFPIARLVAYLPVFNTMFIGRLRFIFVFALSILAGYGVNYFFSKKWDFDKKIKLFNYFYFSIMIFVISMIFLWKKFALNSVASEMWNREIIFLLVVSIASSLIISFLLYYRINSFKHKIFQGLFIVLIVAELFFFTQNYHPAIDKKFIYPKTSAISFLQNNINNYRLTSYKISVDNFKTSIVPNSNIIWNLQDIRGYEIIKPKRYEAFEKHFGAYTYNFFSHKIFDLLGVKYFVQSKSDFENKELEDTENISLAYSDSNINIYENEKVMPRAFVVFNVIKADKYQEAIEIFLGESFDPKKTAIVETDNKNILDLKNETDYIPAEVITYENTKIEIFTNNEENGYLVLTDSYFKGWNAYLDAKKVDIYPSDIAFRGIFLPRGEHTIIFKYEPKSFLYSIYVSLSALLICFIIIILNIKNEFLNWRKSSFVVK